jgi:hypothetical protein
MIAGRAGAKLPASVQQIEEVIPMSETTWVLFSEDTVGR